MRRLAATILGAGLLVGACSGGDVAEPDAAGTSPVASPSPSATEDEVTTTVGGLEVGLSFDVPDTWNELDIIGERDKTPAPDNLPGLFYFAVVQALPDEGAVLVMEGGGREKLFKTLLTAQCIVDDSIDESELEAVVLSGIDSVPGNADPEATRMSVDGYPAVRVSYNSTFSVEPGDLTLAILQYTILTDEKICSASFVGHDDSEFDALDEIAATIPRPGLRHRRRAAGDSAW